MLSDPELTSLFLEKLNRAEDAWDALDKAEQIGKTDIPAGLELLRAACVFANESRPTLTRAAELLAGWGRSEDALETLAFAMRIGAPSSTLQVSQARRLIEIGELRAAQRWFRSALLANRPDPVVAMELARLENSMGYPDCARQTVQFLDRLKSSDHAFEVERARFLWLELGRSSLACDVFGRVHASGYREEKYITDFAWLLTGEMAFERVTELEEDDFVREHDTLRSTLRMLGAHARLSMAFDREELLEIPRQREASDQWVAAADVPALLKRAIAGKRPFSWVRLGDGEARFILYMKREFRPMLSDEDASVLGRTIWFNWFGREIDDEDRMRLEKLASDLDLAVDNADLLGIASESRYYHDTAHFGYLASMEKYIQNQIGVREDILFTESLATYELAGIDPFLSGILEGLDFVGVISPHPQLAERLQAYFGFDQVASYDIPGEGRLARERERTDRGKHFPEAFDQIMAAIKVPYQGAVFLVAGGLLGKIYCDQIKRLGGIALDIGALADAWMGFNTRPGHLDEAAGNTLPV